MVCTSRITKVFAIEVFDSRGNPTVMAEVRSEKGRGWAAAPSGASTGKHEAIELRDGGARLGGRGVKKAVAAVNGKIAKKITGMDVCGQGAIDAALCNLDGTQNKSFLGANATVAVSLAAAQCAAHEQGRQLYETISLGRKRSLPAPMLNVINGGKHADSGLSLQEFMLFPLSFRSFSGALAAGVETYHALRGLVAKKYGRQSTALGDEGGFAPSCASSHDALSLLESAVSECGYGGKIKFAIDAAASSFFESKSGRYAVDGKKLSAGALSDYYIQLTKSFPIASIEDPFEEEAFSDFAALKKRLSGKCQVVGDDLVVTNVERLKKAASGNSISALLLKVNQIGTLSEALKAARFCFGAGMGVIVSHRSGETSDSSIADLAVGIGCGQIKAGAPARGERVAKYNRLLQIEAEGKLPFAQASGLSF